MRRVSLGGAWALGLAAFALGTVAVPSGAAGAATLRSIRVEQAVAVESSAGAVPVTVPITLDSPAATAVTLDYATYSDVPGPGVATPGVDYKVTSGSLTFAPGQVQKNVTVRILPDGISDPDEDFFVAIDHVVGATVARPSGVVRIQDHLSDSPLNGSFAIFDAQPNGKGPKYTAKLTFVLTTKQDVAVTADFSELAGTAQPGVDYVARTGSVTIPAGKLFTTVSVKLLKRPSGLGLMRQFTVQLRHVTGVANQSIAFAHVEIDNPAPTLAS